MSDPDKLKRMRSEWLARARELMPDWPDEILVAAAADMTLKQLKDLERASQMARHFGRSAARTTLKIFNEVIADQKGGQQNETAEIDRNGGK